jgi:hypothetical protein
VGVEGRDRPGPGRAIRRCDLCRAKEAELFGAVLDAEDERHARACEQAECCHTPYYVVDFEKEYGTGGTKRYEAGRLDGRRWFRAARARRDFGKAVLNNLMECYQSKMLPGHREGVTEAYRDGFLKGTAEGLAEMVSRCPRLGPAYWAGVRDRLRQGKEADFAALREAALRYGEGSA